jgi:hypothetical protein
MDAITEVDDHSGPKDAFIRSGDVLRCTRQPRNVRLRTVTATRLDDRVYNTKDHGARYWDIFPVRHWLTSLLRPKKPSTSPTSTISDSLFYSYSLEEGIRNGFLAPYKVIKVHIDVDVGGYRPQKGVERKGADNIYRGVQISPYSATFREI